VRKLFAMPAIVLGVVALSGSTAFAHDCFNASKPTNKGNAVTLSFSGVDENGEDIVELVDPTPGLLKRADRGDDFLRGNVGVDFTGDGVADISFMAPGTPTGVLPDGARLNCDGHGIDSFEACFE